MDEPIRSQLPNENYRKGWDETFGSTVVVRDDSGGIVAGFKRKGDESYRDDLDDSADALIEVVLRRMGHRG
jgi:hypothetical protein